MKRKRQLLTCDNVVVNIYIGDFRLWHAYVLVRPTNIPCFWDGLFLRTGLASFTASGSPSKAFHTNVSMPHTRHVSDLKLNLSDGRKIAIYFRRGVLLYFRSPASNWNPSPCNGHYPSRTTTVPPSRCIHINVAVHPGWDK